jgi:hypothetical protein
MKRSLLLLAFVLVMVGGLGAAWWMKRTFGVVLPLETPKHIVVCDRQYKEGGTPLVADAHTYVLTLRATISDLPLPLPDLAGTDGRRPYNGCPEQVVLELRDKTVIYGLVSGGP